VYLQYNLKAGSNDLAYNTSYTAAGYTIQFTLVKFYISQVALQKQGGEYMTFGDMYLLADADSLNRFYIGTVEAGEYTGIRFGLGVDSSRNDINGSLAIPAYDYPDTHPLSASNQMYWSWNPGYVWMKLEGKIDMNSNGSFSDPGETFGIHTGLPPAYRFIERSYSFSAGGDDINLKIGADILAFFNGYNLAAQRNAHPMTTASPEFIYVTEIVDNAEDVFGELSE